MRNWRRSLTLANTLTSRRRIKYQVDDFVLLMNEEKNIKNIMTQRLGLLVRVSGDVGGVIPMEDYQLWVLDKVRGEEIPVEDVSGSGLSGQPLSLLGFPLLRPVPHRVLGQPRLELLAAPLDPPGYLLLICHS